MATFKELRLSSKINDYLEESGFKKPTAVQEKIIPKILDGKHISVLSQTGSGKTLAYCLPLVQKLKSSEESVEQINGAPRAIIIVPTRELAGQVFQNLKNISHHAKVKIRRLGGKGSRSLKEDWFDILVGVPGQIIAAVDRKEINLKLISTIIFDEADQLLDAGFGKDIGHLVAAATKQDPQYALFSATNPFNYEDFVARTFKEVDFEQVTMSSAQSMQKNIETYNIFLTAKEKISMVEVFLKQQAKGKGIIFINKKDHIDEIHQALMKAFPKENFWVLHGGIERKERQKNYKNYLKEGGILIATDILARGMDINDLQWVLNYDLPFEAVYYIHRCGRTGRNQKKGTVYNFVTHNDNELIGKINTAIASQTALKLERIDGMRINKSKVTKKKVASKNVKKVEEKVTRKKITTRKKTPRYKRK